MTCNRQKKEKIPYCTSTAPVVGYYSCRWGKVDPCKTIEGSLKLDLARGRFGLVTSSRFGRRILSVRLLFFVVALAAVVVSAVSLVQHLAQLQYHVVQGVSGSRASGNGRRPQGKGKRRSMFFLALSIGNRPMGTRIDAGAPLQLRLC